VIDVTDRPDVHVRLLPDELLLAHGLASLPCVAWSVRFASVMRRRNALKFSRP
jgi:hypothetical protein